MTNENQGVFINGKEQIIELLQFLPDSEKQKLLLNIKARNASMAKELSEKSLSFNNILDLEEESLKKVFSVCSPAIIGLALSLATRLNQRKVLSVIARESAEQAFQIMNRDLSTKRRECIKAQEKIVETAISLSRRDIIKLQ